MLPFCFRYGLHLLHFFLFTRYLACTECALSFAVVYLSQITSDSQVHGFNFRFGFFFDIIAGYLDLYKYTMFSKALRRIDNEPIAKPNIKLYSTIRLSFMPLFFCLLIIPIAELFLLQSAILVSQYLVTFCKHHDTVRPE